MVQTGKCHTRFHLEFMWSSFQTLPNVFSYLVKKGPASRISTIKTEGPDQLDLFLPPTYDTEFVAFKK